MDLRMFLLLLLTAVAYLGLYAFAVRLIVRESGTSAHARRLATGDFVLGSEFFTSAKEPVVFFDADQVLAVPKLRNDVVEWLSSTVIQIETTESFDRLVFIEKDSGPVGIFPVHHLVSEKVGIPSCVLRMKRLPWLPAAAVKGIAPQGGERVCLVSDVTTVGGHIERAIEAIQGKYWNAKVVAVVVLVNCDGTTFEQHLRTRHGIPITVNPDLTSEYQRRKREKLARNGEGKATELRLVA